MRRPSLRAPLAAALTFTLSGALFACAAGDTPDPAAASAGNSGASSAADAADLAWLAGSMKLSVLPPQSLIQSRLHGGAPAGFLFRVKGDEVDAIDVWPSARTPFSPQLALFARQGDGWTAQSSGRPRGADPRHLALDGVRLPPGLYKVEVSATQDAQQSASAHFSLRRWSSQSHAPRDERLQLDGSLQESGEMAALLGAHAVGTAWGPDEIDHAASLLRAEPLATAASDGWALLGALQRDRAQPSSIDEVRAALGAAVGSPEQFARQPGSARAAALHWLAEQPTRFFTWTQLPDHGPTSRARAGIDARLSRIQRAWPGASGCQSQVWQASLPVGIYGHVARWSCELRDADGVAGFRWEAVDLFDADGRHLGERTVGAQEPDDD